MQGQRRYGALVWSAGKLVELTFKINYSSAVTYIMLVMNFKEHNIEVLGPVLSTLSTKHWSKYSCVLHSLAVCFLCRVVKPL